MITITDLIHQDACSPFTLPPPEYLRASASQPAQDSTSDATPSQVIHRSDSVTPSLTTATTASPSPALTPGAPLPEMSGLDLLWAAAVHVENSEAHTTSLAHTGGSSEDQTVSGPAKTTTVKSTKGRARGAKKRTREDVETDDAASDASTRPSKRLRRARGFYKE
ncbi:hypothetical protein EXIGLDRAFT_778515 [Exidia glandulosa HHB12029]|uniref:Uncharacterized protein n=1 Tax=Exidia glandulosa HHB12029 TaxID=1314781 RepID=A0A165CH89_EXIGL|nr:hypothetical protein EXIGLDRAFT_778515 [Exidia glandulosa HHB12029]